MVINSIHIDSLAMFHTYYDLPSVWENLSQGHYHKFIYDMGHNNPIVCSIISTYNHYISPSEEVDNVLAKDIINDFINSTPQLSEIMNSLQENNFKQKAVIYLCALMNIHAGYNQFTEHEIAFIYKKVDNCKQIPQLVSRHPNSISAIHGVGFYLNDNQKISPFNSKHSGSYQNLDKIKNFSLYSNYGLLAINLDGELIHQNVVLFDDYVIDTSVKFEMVASFLHTYILLEENGTVQTNAYIVENKRANWKDIAYVYAGQNSICGIKKNGDVINNFSDDLNNVKNAIRVCSYYTKVTGKRFIVLREDNSTIDDNGNIHNDIDAIAINEEGYFLAKGNIIYFCKYDDSSPLSDNELLSYSFGTKINELEVSSDKIFMIYDNKSIHECSLIYRK